MSFTLLSAFVLLLLAATASIEIYRGIHRGFVKTAISFASVVLSLILSVILSPVIGKGIADLVYYTILSYNYDYKSMIRGFEFVDALVQPVGGIVISVVLFVAVFFIARALLGTVMASVYKVISKKNETEMPESVGKASSESWIGRNERKLSIAIGAISAFIISVVIMTPIMGILNVTQDVLDVAVKWNGAYFEQEEMASVVDEVEKYTKDIPGNVLYYSGGELIFKGISSVHHNGKHLSFMNELETVEDAADNFLALYPVMMLGREPNALTSQRIDGLCESIMDLRICTPVLTYYGSMGADAWLRHYMIFGIKKPQLNSVVEDTFDELLRVCAASTDENIQANMVTMLKIYGIILESNVQELSQSSDYKELLSVLEEDGIVDLLLEELKKNPNMKSVESSAQSILVNLVAEEINSLGIETEKYGYLMDDIAAALTDIKDKGYHTREEQIFVMTSTVQDYIGGYGIEISDDIAEYTAELIWDNFENYKGVITEEDMRNFFAALNNIEE